MTIQLAEYKSATDKLSFSGIDAQDAANQYLTKTLGNFYQAENGFFFNDVWTFRICYQNTDMIEQQESPIGIGKLTVNADTGSVLPIPHEQIQQIKEATIVHRLQRDNINKGTPCSQLARNEEGQILRYQAQMLATKWLNENFAMHYSAIDGLYIPLKAQQPIWQFTIRFRLPTIGELKPLGFIDVDALTGNILSLTEQQIQSIQERTRAIIQHRELASAA